jgi:DNA-binding CsgD family transcriptional regulator
MLHCYGEIGRTSETWGTDGRVFDEEWMRGHHSANPTLPFLAAEPGKKLLALRDCYRDELSMTRSLFYRRYVMARGSRDAVALFFWNTENDSVDCALTLHRSEHREDFTEEEVAMLELLHPHIEAAFRRITRQENETCAQESLHHFLSELPVPTVLLDWNLRPLYYNSAARDAVGTWAGGDRHEKFAPSLSIPRDLLAQFESMRETWSKSLRLSPFSTAFEQRSLIHPRIGRLRALLSMTALRSCHFGKPSFLLRFEQTEEPAERRISTLARLTARERALALLVCEGSSNQEIADRLGRSVSTIKSELHSVFRKLGVESRGKLAVLLQ